MAKLLLLVLLLVLLGWRAPAADGQQASTAGAGAGAQQLRGQLLTAFTGSSDARGILLRQLEAMRRFLPRPPPVPEPPPHTTALCRQNGHAECELHSVATEDGYLLRAVRIPAGPGATPVLLLHGNLGSSDSWMMRKDNSNLGTVLNEAGYDVWLGNMRGNTHSRRHLTLNTTDPEYWNFSLHEMGIYDIPAFVDYILARTGDPDGQVHLVGHSMATSAALVVLSSRPQYNARVRLVSLMSPSIRMRRGITRGASDLTFRFFRNNVKNYLKRNDFLEIWHRSALLHYIGDLFCMDSSPLINLCYRMFEEVLGKGHPDQRLPDYLATFGAYHPAGTSFRCIEHLGVINLSGRFRPLGRGLHDPNPPADYNLTAISAPVALYYSFNDGLIDPKDVDRLARLLPNLHEKHLVPLKQFNHVDFMWAKDVRSLIYERLIRNMKEVDSKAKRDDKADSKVSESGRDVESEDAKNETEVDSTTAKIGPEVDSTTTRNDPETDTNVIKVGTRAAENDTKVESTVVKNNTEVDSKAVKMDNKVETRAVKNDTKVETKTSAKNDAKVETKSARNDTKVDSKTIKLDQKVETKATKNDTKVDSKAVKMDKKVETKAAKNDTKVETKTAAKNDAKVEQKSAKNDTKIDSKAVKTDKKVEAKAAKNDTKVDSKAIKMDKKAETKAAKNDTKVETKSAKNDTKIDSKAVKTDKKVEAKAAKNDTKVDSKAIKMDKKAETKAAKNDTKVDSKTIKMDKKAETKAAKNDAKADPKATKMDKKVEKKSVKNDAKVETKTAAKNGKVVDSKAPKNEKKIDPKTTKNLKTENVPKTKTR